MTRLSRAGARRAAALALGLALSSAGLLGAQVPTSAPALGPAPSVRMPKVERARLANGLELMVVTMREVPVVEVQLQVPGGARADGDLAGLATFTARLMTEGADTLDAFGISAAAEYLGASVGASADWDALTLSLRAPKRTLPQAMDLLATIARKPAFRGSDVARQRGLRLAQLAQQRDQPEAVAQRVFSATLYPAAHPYHRAASGDSLATTRLDSAAVRAFYTRVFQPRGARMIVTGDISLAEARGLVEARFRDWAANGSGAALAGGATPAAVPAKVYLVDKPGAAQSVLQVGLPGVERTSPDYVALTVMNTLLGGSFSSRLNDVLREQRGYTYGANSAFVWAPLPGPWQARTAVRTNVTDSAMIDLLREIRRLRDEAPAAEELTRARNYVALQLAGAFETPGQVASRLDGLVRFGLPLDYYDTLVPKVLAVTAADVQRVARQYVRPDNFVMVIVGDLKVIRPGLEKLGLGEMVVVDGEGRPVAMR